MLRSLKIAPKIKRCAVGSNIIWKKIILSSGLLCRKPSRRMRWFVHYIFYIILIIGLIIAIWMQSKFRTLNKNCVFYGLGLDYPIWFFRHLRNFGSRVICQRFGNTALHFVIRFNIEYKRIKGRWLSLAEVLKKSSIFGFETGHDQVFSFSYLAWPSPMSVIQSILKRWSFQNTFLPCCCFNLTSKNSN